MNELHGIKITARDRVLRAWENTMELVRDFRKYVDEIEDNDQLREMFEEYAQTLAQQASQLLDILRRYDQEKKKECKEN
ncbi:MAG: rubrerythrin [bacterium]|nr:rubrerythrin [bacterium]